MADLLSAATPNPPLAGLEAGEAASAPGAAVTEGAPVGRVSNEAAGPAQPAPPSACLLSIEVLLSGDSRSLVFSPSQEAVQVLAAPSCMYIYSDMHEDAGAAYQMACMPHDPSKCMQREAAALVRSWTDHLAQFKGPGASPALCKLLEEEGDFVPTGPPLADLLASDVHQLQADALRKAIAETFSLADIYKQVLVWTTLTTDRRHACAHHMSVLCRASSHCWKRRSWPTVASTSLQWQMHMSLLWMRRPHCWARHRVCLLLSLWQSQYTRK